MLSHPRFHPIYLLCALVMFPKLLERHRIATTGLQDLRRLTLILLIVSRLMYKGMRIEWIPDECSSPLPKQPVSPKKEISAKPVKKPSVGTNRFQMLNMDETDTSDDDSADAEDDTILPTFSAMRINHRSPWNPPTVAV